MEYRLIALDLDGTLLTSRQRITPRTREALRAARERGIITAIATGRSPQSALHFSRLIGGGPVICCNGAGLLDEAGRMIATKPIPTAPLQRAIAICAEAGLLLESYTEGGIVMDRPLAHLRAYMNWIRPRLGLLKALAALAHIWRSNRARTVRSLAKWAQRPDHAPVLKLMVVGAEEALQRAAARMNREVPGLAVTSSGRENLEVMAAGVSKAYGLEVLGARLRIPRAAMLAFGDSPNDLEMLTYAGTGVAMGNAPEAVKAAAARVTGTSDEDGVASVIEEVCLS